MKEHKTTSWSSKALLNLVIKTQNLIELRVNSCRVGFNKEASKKRRRKNIFLQKKNISAWVKFFFWEI